MAIESVAEPMSPTAEAAVDKHASAPSSLQSLSLGSNEKQASERDTSSTSAESTMALQSDQTTDDSPPDQLNSSAATLPTTAPENLPSEKSSTIYPKIHKFSDLLYNLKYLQDNGYRLSNPLRLTGTIKLHGTHADIVFPKGATSDDFNLQSRNKTSLTPGIDDNAGFAAWIAAIGARPIVTLRDDILKTYRSLYPNVTPAVEDLASESATNQEIIIAGEFCGIGIQKGVAISRLPKFLAIVSISVNGRWLPDRLFSQTSAEAHRIFHIGRAGFYNLDLDLTDPEPTRREIERLTLKVDKQCPFAKALDSKAMGKGEGIVWKVDTEHHNLVGQDTSSGAADAAVNKLSESRFWFKSKGEQFATSQTEGLKRSDMPKGGQAMVDVFVGKAVTENRLEQGVAYLREMGQGAGEGKENEERGGIGMKGLGTFVKWVVKDVEDEEVREMKELGLNKGAVKRAVSAVARQWFLAKVEEGAL